MGANLRKAAWCVIAALVMTCALTGCIVGVVQQKTSPYQWDCLQWGSDGRATYADGTFSSVAGIDVSESQGYIDWDAVAGDGIEFAFIRLGNRGSTEGGLYLDDYYAYNLDAAHQAGITVNAYFYSQATTTSEAIEEARYALELLEGHDFDGQIAYDLEISSGGRVAGMTKAQATQCARAFCQCVQEAGYSPVLYGNAADLEYYEDALLDEIPLWFAAYAQGAPSTVLPFTYWQYASDGEVAGIDVPVDMNIQMKSASDSSEAPAKAR